MELNSMTKENEYMFITTYYSHEKNNDGVYHRTADIFLRESYMVVMYDHGIEVERRNITGHNLQYVEDCAENWVLGVI